MNQSGDRRNLSREFVDAVSNGLKAIGDKSAPLPMAKVLATQPQIGVSDKTARHGSATIDNPHIGGTNPGQVADTLRRMAGK